MVRTPLQTAILFALLSAVPALQAEATAPDTAAAPVEAAAEASATPADHAAPAPAAEATTTPADQAATASASAPDSTTESKGDTLAIPKETAKPARKRAARTPVKVVVDGMPGRGATMAEVEKHFGKPRQKLAAVGKPPIARWVYDNYTVYFEHQYVIHSVKEESPPPTMPSTPERPAAEHSDSISPPVSDMAAPAEHESGSDTPAAPASE